MANTSGLSATDPGTALPPQTPARIRWNMSAAYRREHDGHSLERRFPHRIWVTPSGSWLLAYDETISPVSPVDSVGMAVQPDRVSAVPHPGQRLGPAVEAG